MDFTKQWNDKNLGLKRAKGDGTLTFLTNHAFKGLNTYIRYPWFQVHTQASFPGPIPTFSMLKIREPGDKVV